MHYVGNVIRPPSEANSIILQVTVGCSSHRCTFCGAFKEVDYQNKQNVRCQFHANHTSSYLPLTGRLPKERDALLRTLETAMSGGKSLVPEYHRAL